MPYSYIRVSGWNAIKVRVRGFKGGGAYPFIRVQDPLNFILGFLQELSRLRQSGQLLPRQAETNYVRTFAYRRTMRFDEAVVAPAGCEDVLDFLVVDALEQHPSGEEVFLNAAKRVDVDLCVDT